MSTGDKISHSFAMTCATRMVEILEPECDRIEIAGSLRRQQRLVGDIDLVLIPKPLLAPQRDTIQTTFFADHIENQDIMEPVFGSERIERRLIEYGYVLSKNGPLFKQAHLPGSQLMFEIALVTPEKWGVMFMIKTGNAYFSHKMVTKRCYNGFCPSNIDFKHGRLKRGNQLLDTPEEEDVFREFGMEFVPPEKRY